MRLLQPFGQGNQEKQIQADMKTDQYIVSRESVKLSITIAGLCINRTPMGLYGRKYAF
jgi:hypothetical protein